MRSFRITRRLKALLVVAVLVACSTVTSACETIEHSWPGLLGSANYPLQIDYQLSEAVPGYWPGTRAYCVFRASQVAGRRDSCRIVAGYDQAPIYDWRNWRIHNDTSPLSYEYVSGHGWTIVTESGLLFEGCKRLDPTKGAVHDWECDYHILEVINMVSGESSASWHLRKVVNWTKYVGNTAGCAAFLTGLSAGNVITLPGITGCADGPL